MVTPFEPVNVFIGEVAERSILIAQELHYQVRVRVSDFVHDNLQKLAKREGVCMACIVRRLIYRYLNEELKKCK